MIKTSYLPQALLKMLDNGAEDELMQKTYEEALGQVEIPVTGERFLGNQGFGDLLLAQESAINRKDDSTKIENISKSNITDNILTKKSAEPQIMDLTNKEESLLINQSSEKISTLSNPSKN